MQQIPTTAELPILTLPPERCSYLPGRVAQMQYRWAAQISAQTFEPLLIRGWRRFGDTIFRPACANCQSCRSLRVNVDKFTPSKSQRRALRRNTDVTIVTQPVSVTNQHIALFNAYHRDMHARRGWRRETISEDDYYLTFVVGEYDFAHEMLYYRDEQLIGVGLVDLLPHSSSSVYFYHDPAWRADGPGTYSMLTEIAAARTARRSHHYLGYWIAENQSMQYKANFRPHQLLQEHVTDDELPVWESK